jgi:GNAT superfamily N-acetyltransferase
MRVRLKPVSLDDASALFQWIKRYYQFDHITFDARSIRRGIKTLLRHPNYGMAWFICAEGGTVGYIILTYGFDMEFGGLLGIITDFYIGADQRAKGIGSSALKQAFAFARRNGLSAIELQVIKSNKIARRFYQNAGFTCHDRRLMSRRTRRPSTSARVVS